jgi:hypothetical protein
LRTERLGDGGGAGGRKREKTTAIDTHAAALGLGAARFKFRASGRVPGWDAAKARAAVW